MVRVDCSGKVLHYLWHYWPSHFPLTTTNDHNCRSRSCGGNKSERLMDQQTSNRAATDQTHKYPLGPSCSWQSRVVDKWLQLIASILWQSCLDGWLARINHGLTRLAVSLGLTWSNQHLVTTHRFVLAQTMFMEQHIFNKNNLRVLARFKYWTAWANEWPGQGERTSACPWQAWPIASASDIYWQCTVFMRHCDTLGFIFISHSIMQTTLERVPATRNKATRLQTQICPLWLPVSILKLVYNVFSTRLSAETK